MNISEPFIRRPIATSLLAAAILLAGIAAYRLLPVAPLPRVDFPSINVSVGLPGASAETMAASVATPLERRFGRIAGVNEITSSSSLGSSSLTLQFDLNRDVDAAARDVQAAINASAADLPPNLPLNPNYRKVNPADSPILILALTSDTMTQGQMYDAANTVLAQKISQVTGVGQVFAAGGQNPAVRVQVDPVALAGVGLDLEAVRAVLGSATLDEPKGLLNGSVQAQTLAASDQLLGAAAYQNLVLTYKNGSPVRLKDVAKVFDDVENNRVGAWYNGTPSCTLIVRREPGANIIETIERVKALLPELALSVSPSIKVSIALDRSTTIRASVDDVQFTLILSVFLVVLVVFVFLKSPAATAVPSVAVPLSLVATFGAMYLLGYSVDNLSLMALTISTGFVVDDAIVVTENISRYVEQGLPPIEAALKGASQIGFTIVSITASLLAVFLPILLMGGVVGKLFREFAVTLSVSIAVSALVSLTLTPMMCSRVLRHTPESQHGFFYRITEAGFQGMLNTYERGLKWVLRHQRTTLVGTLLLVVFNAYLFVIVPKGLFPQQDTGFLAGSSQGPQDVSFPSMRDRQMAANAVFAKDPNIRNYVSFLASFNGSTGNQGSFFIDLQPKPPRTLTADQVIGELRAKLSHIPGTGVFLQAVQDVRMGGRSSKTQYQYSLEDANLEELRSWAPKVLERLAKLPQLKDVATDLQTGGLELNVGIDRDTASRLGITPAAVDNSLYDAYGERLVATQFTQLNQYHVVMEVTPRYQRGPDALNDIFVSSNAGLVPLDSFTHVGTSSTALSVTHQGQFPVVTLSFNLAPKVALGDAVEAINKAEAQIGMPQSIYASFQGTAQAFQASLASEPLLLLAALLTVYIVLGMLYESLIHPITILSTLPSAGIGAILALLLTGLDFSVIALIGIILLIGIVKKNAIMMVDFAIEVEREKGLAPEDSIYQACMLRFRPIMMTTMAAILGALPLAVGHGAGSELRQPLGVSIVGGLLISQLLTLFTTPVIYVALDRLSNRKRHLAKPSQVVAAPA